MTKQDKIRLNNYIKENVYMSNIMDTKKFIKFCEDRMSALKDRIDRDCAGGLVDDLAKYNETKMIKEAAQRGVFTPPIWE